MPASFSFDVNDGRHVRGCGKRSHSRGGVSWLYRNDNAGVNLRRRRITNADGDSDANVPTGGRRSRCRGWRATRIRQRSCVMASPRLLRTSTSSAVWIMAQSRTPLTAWISPLEQWEPYDLATGMWEPRAPMPFESEAPTCALMETTGIVYCAEGDTVMALHLRHRNRYLDAIGSRSVC